MKHVHLKSLLAVAFLITASAHAEVVKVTLNGLEIGIDGDTGSVVSLHSAAAGDILAARADAAGILDVAYPTATFAPMRLATRFSRARIEQGANEVTLTWERLGASRPTLPLPAGAVRATVRIRADADGRSIVFSAHVQNDSPAPVPQVLFPDLWGLQPFEGVQGTRLRLARKVVRPFEGPVASVDGTPFYAYAGSPIAWKEYPADGYYSPNSLRWLDLGGFRAGLSVFQKKWGTFDWPNVITHRSERDPLSLRMAWEHQQNIAPGKSWDSGEFWFTPHAGGWAKGVEVYRDYARKVVPARALPDHVAQDIGYQTIWMIQTAESDPKEAVFRYEDLPRVAEDARRYGIHEVVPWGWNIYSTMPIPVRPELGTVADLQKAVRAAHDIGVNIAPFISISVVRNQYAKHYGAKPANNDWSYHYELVPTFRPYYTKFWNGVEIDSNSPVWQRDVKNALGEWIDRGVTSFSWDVFRTHENRKGGRPPLLDVVDSVRAHARARDPQSTFSGESVTHLEFESEALDYLWNWNDYEDAAPITNVLAAPRISCNVERSPLVVAKCFADNHYMNVMPRKLDMPNGTALISDEPDLARALLQAAALRKQFLPYFTQGTFIGDSVLSREVDAFVRGYQRTDGLLVVALNDQPAQRLVSIESDLALWLPRAARYEVTSYDGSGRKLGSSEIAGPQWRIATPPLDPGELAFFEVKPK
jgi:hypothetical protein